MSEKEYKNFYTTQDRNKFELAPSVLVKPTKDCYLDGCEGLRYTQGFFEDFEAEPLSFYVLEDAILVDGVVVIHNNEVIKETVYQAGYKTSMLESPILHGKPLKIKECEPSEYIQQTSFLFNTLLENFAHWHMQSLANTAFFEKIEEVTGEKTADMVFINTNGFEKEHFRAQSIDKFGLSSFKFINPRENNCHRTIRFKKLIVPTTHMISAHHRFNPFIAQSLRAKMLLMPKLDKNSPKRIFINRKDAPGQRRNITNVEELEQKLQKQGFISLSTGNLSYEDQLSLFYNAEMIISPHAGSLTGLLAGNPDLKILELFNSVQLNGWYRNLADSINIKYKSYCVDVSEYENRLWDMSFSVNTDLIEKIVNDYLFK